MILFLTSDPVIIVAVVFAGCRAQDAYTHLRVPEQDFDRRACCFTCYLLFLVGHTGNAQGFPRRRHDAG